jgi:hypothetical protein
MGYYAATAEYTLKMTNAGDLWEDVYVEVFCDASFDNKPRSWGGHLVSLRGDLGTFCPQAWEAKLHTFTATSSTDSESVQWGRASKAAVILAAMVERTRVTRVRIVGRVDNDSLRLAAQRGSSSKLAALGRQGDVNFKFMCESGLIPVRVPGQDNVADIFTKILSRARLVYLISEIFALQAERDVDGKYARVRNDQGLVISYPDIHDSLCVCAGMLDHGLVHRWWNRAISIWSSEENEEFLDPCDCNYRRGALVGPASAADLAIRTIEHRTLERFLRRNYSVEELRAIAQAD